MGDRSKKWFYIGRQDDCEHGPYTSKEMLLWLRCHYFDESLRLRTENDSRFYTLSDWIQACGNKVPFEMDGPSMEQPKSNTFNGQNYGSAQLTENMHMDPFLQRPPTNPASTANPLVGGTVDSERQQVQLGVPIQLLTASQKAPSTAQQVLLMNAQPSPNQPLVIPVSSVPTYQFVQQHAYPSMSQQQPLMPIRLQAQSMLPHQIQQRFIGDTEQSQQDGTTIVSDSPDSGHVMTPSSYPINQICNGLEVMELTQQRSERILMETMDGSWKRGMVMNGMVKMVDNWTNMEDDAHCQQSKGTQTEDIMIKISQADAERLLFQLLGIRLRINFASEK
ncbi:hypothetical protein GPALN_012800 [Globodera pallida]|uniref:GYF domain-containing protein n=1 Tax=Globodera pallida TaxID=36090 RepID=A0A183BTI6_GLOPA|nr:hypothetical protein GPALN_012800 [Globodera pallida]